MKRYSLRDYFLYIVIRGISGLFVLLPSEIAVFVGRILGLLLYYLDRKHRLIAFKNLRMCLSPYRDIKGLKNILKKNFENFGMNVIETLIIPKIDKEYVRRNIQIEGLDYLEEILKKRRGAILLGIHMGNWEICFAVAGILGFPFYILVEEQRKNPLLDRFLNQIRENRGAKIIYAGKHIKYAIKALKENKILGLVADHGVKEGIILDFFGHQTRVPTLAIRLALNLEVSIIPGYIVRKNLIKHKIRLLPSLSIRRTSDFKSDLITNINMVNRIFEQCIRENPQDYFWFYRRFKYNQDRTILVLEDGKAGHQKQLDSLLEIFKEVAEKKGLLIKVERIKVEFKNSISKNLQIIGVGLARRSQCMMCAWCLRKFLKPETFLKINYTYADIVVSCGSSLAGVNFVVSSLNQAKSIVIMRPSILSTKRFDLVIAPFHDRLPRRRNTLILEGALSHMDYKKIQESKDKIKELIKVDFEPSFYIGLLIGGDTRNFRLNREVVLEVINQIKKISQQHNAVILLTTSRRTPREIEELIKKELSQYYYCGVLVIANEKNYPFVVEGILGLSKFVIVSPESISMISEAVSAENYVLVFRQRITKRRHRLFLENFSQKKYLYLIEPEQISQVIEEIIIKKPSVVVPKDREKIIQALERLL